MKFYRLLPSLLGTLPLLCPAAQAAQLQSWRFDPGQNRLDFATDTAIQPRAQVLANPTRLVIDLPGTTVTQPLAQQTVGGAIQTIRVGQLDAATTRIVLEVTPGYTFDASRLTIQGLTPSQWFIQLPPFHALGASVAPVAAAKSALTSAHPTSAQLPAPAIPVPGMLAPPLATIQSVDLINQGTQLLIRADRPLRQQGQWDRQTGTYLLRLSPARLPATLSGPQLGQESPLGRLRFRQDSPDTVLVLAQPRPGVQILGVNQPSSQTVAIQLQVPPAAVRSSLPPTIAYQGGTATMPPALARPAQRPRGVSTGESRLSLPQGMRIAVIDPGHGGPDPGAVGIGDLYEKNVVLPIAQQVAAILEQHGVRAILTRNDDRDLDLEPRVQIAEQANATVFVSIHANSLGLDRPDINGLETYYFSSGEQLAQIIHTNITQTLPVRDRGVRQARFYVLRRTSMPSVLVETGYVTGAEDAPRLANPAYRSQMAAAIARGILQYLQQGN
ncbi:N-acetylmuramoyl-L-alanine amidase [Trichothermofontia sp.]